MTDIFREVDEDLRNDNLVRLWKRYGNYLIGLAVLIVVGTGGYTFWQRQAESHRMERGREFLAAADKVGPGDNKEAMAAFTAISSVDDGYGTLARFRLAGLKARSGDQAGAVALYDAIAADGSLGAPFRDLATILAVEHSLEKGDPAALAQRLQPLTAEASPWRFSALELSGLLARRAGDTKRAIELFSKLSDDRQAPQTTRARAAEVLAALRG
ncbi:MAG: tetratricopeptide repeat protein [Dongiaceae bacterium]